MRWLITGAGGMLAADLAGLLDDAVALSRAELDIRDKDAVTRAVREHRPDVIVNCAAWTAVDDAERHEEEALAVNGHAVANLAGTGARLIQISTDYVFDGTSRVPYAEDAPTRPVNAYGRSKLVGELAADGHVIVRTAWLYGASGRNFVKTMIRLERERESVSVVADQHGGPTWSADLARYVATLGDAPPGIHHGTNAGQTTWHGLAREVFTLLGADPARVKPIPASDYPVPAPRPAYSVLGNPRLRDWREALGEAFVEIQAGLVAGQQP
ncbi:dTDP-4-dehydrorhamnose reductase [Nonomuraea sp. NPDC050663]|uniref:dTDP-4-dehydrorhamnose reductase n=1 Tax=Nonomuraea sp. NPDC050663 TaxID=3364370 RepID=UPI00378E2FE7